MGNKYINIHQDLLERCREGDQKAQFEIYRLYYKSMYNSSLRIVGVPEEAEDIMQESFLTAFRKLKTYSEDVSFDMKDLTGKGTFEIKYGELNGQKLFSPDLSLDIAYSKVNIDAVKDLSLELRYSKFKLDKGNNLKVETRYSGMNIGESNKIESTSKYDNYSIQNINTLIINSMYTGITIDQLNSKLNLVNGYGGVTVKKIPAGFESIDIENKYAGIKLGIAADAAYQLNGKVRYSNIDHPEGKLSKMRENTSYEVNGTVGNSENPKSSVRINSSYGNVSLVP